MTLSPPSHHFRCFIPLSDGIPPVVIEPLVDFTAQAAQSVIITCKINRGTPVCDIKWYVLLNVIGLLYLLAHPTALACACSPVNAAILYSALKANPVNRTLLIQLRLCSTRRTVMSNQLINHSTTFINQSTN